MNTVLFDLDGTLLPLDTDAFTIAYFDRVTASLSDLTDTETLIKTIWAATETMVKNTEERTNEEVFMEKLHEIVGDKLDEYQERFLGFYDKEYLDLKNIITPEPFIVKSIGLLKQKGYELAIATNPLFPKKAVLRRIEWAGLNPGDFSYITCYEENHYCKPQLQFYEEVLRCIGKAPEECMMVGNDVLEDLISSKLGIKTYLIKDHVLNEDKKLVADNEGFYWDFYEFVASLPDLTRN